MNMENLRVCLVQMELAWEDPAANRAAIEALLADQQSKHDLVVLPEMFTTGFTMNASKVAEQPGGETEQWMQALATYLGAVIVGSIVVQEQEAYYNRLLVVTKNGTALHYDKRHLFRMAGEHQVFTPGTMMQVFTLKGWRILPLVCYDLRFPIWSRNKLEEDGRLYFDVMLYVANWPERRVHHWKSLLVARAIENQSYTLGVNRVGADGNNIVYSGDSAIIDPLGFSIITATTQGHLLTATLDWEVLSTYRERFPAWADADRFDVYA